MGAFYAVLAAIIWGFDYALAEKMLEKLSITTIATSQLLISGFIFAGFALFSDTLKSDILTLQKDTPLLVLFFTSILIFCSGFFLIFKSIEVSNATIAGLIEISYPLFIILATWVLLKKTYLSPAIIIGGIFICSGVFIISYFGQK